MKKNSGIIWPIGISLAILCVVGLGAWTIVETGKEPVEESDIYMNKYQDVDNNANDFINAKIAFDKKYSIEYLGDKLNVDNAKFIYKITTKDGTVVNDAKIKLIATRPQTHKQDTKLPDANVSNGVYSFETKLPGVGRWDIMASIEIGTDKRYYNLHMDTTKDTKPTEY
jgi:nitrogen fixation protein FixH